MKNQKIIDFLMLSVKEQNQKLKELGWEPWYHHDNFIHVDWGKQGLAYDKMGKSKDDLILMYFSDNAIR